MGKGELARSGREKNRLGQQLDQKHSVRLKIQLKTKQLSMIVDTTGFNMNRHCSK